MFSFVSIVCRRDEDYEHVTLPDSDSELESGQCAEFEKVVRVCYNLHSICRQWNVTVHWLDVVDHIKYRLCVSVYKCLHGMAPQYLSELCTPVAKMPGRRRLRCAGRGQLHTRRFRLTNYGGRSFCCAATSTAGLVMRGMTAYLRENSVGGERYVSLEGAVV